MHRLLPTPQALRSQRRRGVPLPLRGTRAGQQEAQGQVRDAAARARRYLKVKPEAEGQAAGIAHFAHEAQGIKGIGKKENVGPARLQCTPHLPREESRDPVAKGQAAETQNRVPQRIDLIPQQENRVPQQTAHLQGQRDPREHNQVAEGVAVGQRTAARGVVAASPAEKHEGSAGAVAGDVAVEVEGQVLNRKGHLPQVSPREGSTHLETRPRPQVPQHCPLLHQDWGGARPEVQPSLQEELIQGTLRLSVQHRELTQLHRPPQPPASQDPV